MLTAFVGRARVPGVSRGWEPHFCCRQGELWQRPNLCAAVSLSTDERPGPGAPEKCPL